jgi:hypothetical protein
MREDYAAGIANCTGKVLNLTVSSPGTTTTETDVISDIDLARISKY